MIVKAKAAYPQLMDADNVKFAGQVFIGFVTLFLVRP